TRICSTCSTNWAMRAGSAASTGPAAIRSPGSAGRGNTGSLPDEGQVAGPVVEPLAGAARPGKPRLDTITQRGSRSDVTHCIIGIIALTLRDKHGRAVGRD